ncbi:MAG: hypothetical protein ABSA16_10435 [Thermoguttaceae bacterium]|jgi:hypothetical protein
MVTGYSRLSARQARAVLAILILGTLFCIEVAVSPLWQGNFEQKSRGSRDVALFRAMVDRMHNGEGFYQASAAELTARGYPTRSVFNWRTPLPMWPISRLPRVEWAKYFFAALSLGVIVLAFEALARDQEFQWGQSYFCYIKGDSPIFTTRKSGQSPYIRFGCVVLLSGPLLFTVLDDLFVMPELWAGVLIACSLCAYGMDKPKLGLGFGLTALFVRELALPYCLLCAGMALLEWWKCKGDSPIFADHRSATESGKSGQFPWELVGWGLGFSAWLIFYGWHWWNVSGLINPGALAHKHGWIRFGGAGFVLATARMNAYLFLLPPWVTALYFASAMFGLGGWHSPLGTRIGLTVCLYVMFFAVVGQDFNQYWGSVIAPLLCFGVVRLPASMRDLCRAAGISITKTPMYSPGAIESQKKNVA